MRAFRTGRDPSPGHRHELVDKKRMSFLQERLKGANNNGRSRANWEIPAKMKTTKLVLI
jgi:hypothetical protein